MSAGTADFFITGGTLGQDTPSYVERRADIELFEGLKAGEFCYVLTARQIGKSSLMVRTAVRLRDEGCTVVTLDLTSVGQNLSLEQWYYGLLNRLARELELRSELREFWVAHPEVSPLQRFMTALRDVVLPTIPGPRLVIFIDEIDTVLSLPFKMDELFAAVRECYNRRSEDPMLQRLTFCLLGVASPSDLIQDARTTPFNIGRRVELLDFTTAEAAPLAAGLRLGAVGNPLRSPTVAERLLGRVIYWTEGHPYLTQRLCRAVAEDAGVQDVRGVDRLCRELFLEPGSRERDDNLYFVQERLAGPKVESWGQVSLYHRVRCGRKVPCDDTDPRVALLKLSGVVREKRGRLVVRNRIYHRVFDCGWAKTHLPAAEQSPAKSAWQAAKRRGLVVALALLAAAGLGAGIHHRETKVRHVLAASKLEHGVQLLGEGDGLGLLELVEAYESAVGEPRLQQSIGEIWAGWHAVHQSRLSEILDNGAEVTAMAASSRGKQLAVGGADGTIRLYNPVTGSQAGGVLNHSERVTRMAFSPGRDLLAAAGEQRLTLWDVRSGRRLQELRIGSPAHAVAFASGDDLITVRTRTELLVWSTDTGEPLSIPVGPGSVVQATGAPGVGGPIAIATEQAVTLYWPREKRESRLQLPRRDTVLHLEFAPDGKTLALSWGDEVRLWNVERESLLPRILRSPEPVKRLYFGDGGWLATQGEETARLWQTRDATVPNVPLPHGAEIGDVQFDPAMRSVATFSIGRLTFWEIQTGRKIGQMFQQGGYGVSKLSFGPGWVASAPAGSTLRIWKTPGHPAPDALLSPGNTQELAWYSGDGQSLKTADLSDVLEWKSTDGRSTGRRIDLRETGYRLAVSPDRRTLATTGNGSLHLWSTDGDPKARTALPHRGEPTLLEFSPDGRWVALGTDSQGLWIAGAATGTRHAWPAIVGVVPQRIAFSPDGNTLAVAGKGAVEILSLAGPESRRVIETAGPVAWLGFIPGTHYLVAAAGNSLTRYDLASEPIAAREYALPARIRAVAADGTGNRLAVSSRDHQVRIYDLTQMQPLGEPMRHDHPVGRLEFSPDGRLLATCAGFKHVQLWSTASGERYGELLPHREMVRSMEFRPDGRQLAVLAENGVHLWTIPQAERLLTQMQLKTWVTLGARSTNAGVEPIPPAEWRRMRGGLRTTKEPTPSRQDG